MQQTLGGYEDSYSRLRQISPHFIESLETLISKKTTSSDLILHDLPSCLNLRNRKDFDNLNDWHDYLSIEDKNGLTAREVYLRVLLVYAVSDQGADIPGVRDFLNEFITSCYSDNKRIFHEIQKIGDSIIIKHAANTAENVFNRRSEDWAKIGNRKASRYSVFTVDSVNGKPSANWYVNSRISPPLSLPFQIEGGLTALLSQINNLVQARNQIRQDVVHGLFYTIGDKALHLYLKWVFGTLRLFPKEIGIPLDYIPVPMDQRIGIVLMRCGFMDEFCNLDSCHQAGKYLLSKPGGSAVRDLETIDMSDRIFLRVTDFRKNGRLVEPSKSILQPFVPKYYLDNVLKKSIDPQIAINCILILRKLATKEDYYTFEFDDAMMHVANFCHDINPDCLSCPISSTCQANNVLERSTLKKYYT